MKVYVNKITGIDDAIVSMYMSKRTWTRELEDKIRFCATRFLTPNGKLYKPDDIVATMEPEKYAWFVDELNKVVKWGARHMTMLRFIDFSITVEGIHRAGQDDIDAHSMRFNNRIIRSSTRLANFSDGEKSEYYQDKILTMNEVIDLLNFQMPEEIWCDGNKYVKSVNGYILEDMKDNKDVKRGLYMLSIPSNFISKIQLTEWAHVYKERNIDGTANPEVKQFCEAVCDAIEEMVPQFNRDLFKRIPN